MGSGLSESFGKWVSDEDMHPDTNVYGRRFWASGPTVDSDIEGTFYGTWPTRSGMKPQGVFWLFTPDQCQPLQPQQQQ